MSESEIINSTPFLRTRESLTADLRRVGVYPGICVLVHSSLSSLGWVGERRGSERSTGLNGRGHSKGTLIMPAHSGEYSDPAKWGNPRCLSTGGNPSAKRCPLSTRATHPPGAWEPSRKPSRLPGRAAQQPPGGFFHGLGQTSCVHHREPRPRKLHGGMFSPGARLYDLGGWVLLLDVGTIHCSSMHLAEYRVSEPTPTVEAAPIYRGQSAGLEDLPGYRPDSDPLPADRGRFRVGANGGHLRRCRQRPGAVDAAARHRGLYGEVAGTTGEINARGLKFRTNNVYPTSSAS